MRKIQTLVGHQVPDPDLESIIRDYKYGRYFEDKSLEVEGSRKLVFDRTKAFMARDDSSQVSALSDTGEMVGLLLFRRSAWDTDHFGFPVAIVDSVMTKSMDHDSALAVSTAMLSAMLDWCKKEKIRFLSTRVPSLDLPVVHGFQSAQFEYIESWIYNIFDMRRHKPSNPMASRLRASKPSDVELMLQYSLRAFATQRIHADHRMDREKCEGFYKKWILSAVADPRQEILAVDVDGKPAAFMIYYRDDLRRYNNLQFAMWKTALLDPNQRGKGLGTDFFQAVCQKHADEGLDVVDSGLSMRNLASLNLHNKLGFKIISTMITFHKWLW